ncbi:MAG TPA: methyl-accepting chemotaxis protein [Caproicibacter sp.]|nr:methyl-accepting chemotaxis protein [Caproicibacter sp.]
MKNLKISAKLILSFLAISFISLIIGICGIVSLLQMKASSQTLYEQETAPIPVISSVISDVKDISDLARDYILYGKDASQKYTLQVKAAQYLREYNAAMAKYEPTLTDPKLKPFFNDAKNRFSKTMYPLFQQIVKDMNDGKTSQAMQHMDSFKTAARKVTGYYSICMNRTIVTAEANNTQNQNTASVMTIILAAIIVIGAAGSVLWGFWLSRILSKPINEMAIAARSLSEGNLDVNISYVSKDEIGSLANSLKTASSTLKQYVKDISYNLDLMAKGNMAGKITQDYRGDFAPIKISLLKISHDLSDTLSTINMSAEQVNSGAGQVSGGAQALAQGATEQASSIQELSASISEISESVGQNAKNVDVVSNYVKNAVSGVNKSNTKMQTMLSAMSKISNSSAEIKKIIKVIDDIAFQTNILALNAAVEAARAGEAGKGFAVVADEVRNLAGKSANAAKQTSLLIESSIGDVQQGSDIANETAVQLSEVASQVNLVGETIQKIDKASSDQARAITQITQGVDQVSAVVQTNSATAEQSAAASEELSAQADSLTKLTEKFELAVS